MINIGLETKKWAEGRNLKVFFEHELISTNQLAKESLYPKEPGEFSLFITNHQLKGYGRHHSSWEDDAPGAYLLSTWAYQTYIQPQPIAVPLVGWALFEAVQTVWPHKGWSLKAPNDLFLDSKKICGILIENVNHGELNRFIVGIGFNVFNHPKSVEQAGHISQVIHDLSNSTWFTFLDSLKNELDKVISQMGHAEMDSNVCKQLLTALNYWPGLIHPYKKVKANGDLVLENGTTISWCDL